MTGIVGWAVNNARLVIAAIISTLVIGMIAYAAIPREADPDIQFPFVNITLLHPGISPEDGERLLIRPMETQLRTIEGLEKITSTAVLGVANIGLQFDVNFDSEKAIREVNQKVDMAKAELPSDTEEPIVQEASTALNPSITVVLSGEVPDRVLFRIADELEDKLETLPTVLSADISGKRDDQLEIVIDPAKLQSYGVSLTEFFQAVTRNNTLIPAGSLDTGQGRFAVKVPGLIEGREDVLNLPIKMSQGTVVTLGDVADIRRTFVDADTYARFNGRPAVSLDVVKRAGTNIMETINAAKATVAEAQKSWPPGIVVDFNGDQSDFITRTLNSLTQSVILAIILVMIVVVAALGLRSGMLVGFAIPTSFILGITFLYFEGLTLNQMVMFSLILSVGMLVDGAIIVVEFADRKMAEGLPPRQAYAMAGTRMFWPVVSSAAATIAAFAPMLLWPGIPGKFMSYFPITLIAVLSASTVVAMVFLPVIGGYFGKHPPGGEEALKAIAASEQGNIDSIPGITGAYARFISRRVRKPRRIILGAVATLIAVYVAFGMFNSGVLFFVNSDPEFANVIVSARGNLSATEKRDMTMEVEKRVLSVAGLKGVYTVTGINGGGRRQIAEDAIGVMFLEMVPYAQRRPGRVILDEIRQRTSNMPGLKVEVRELAQGPVQGKDINIELGSDEPALLEDAVTKLKTYMMSQPTLRDVEDTRSLPGIEWAVKVDRAKAGQYGVSVSDVGAVVQLVTTGVKVGEYRPNDVNNDVDIRVRYPLEARSIEALSELRVPTANGMVPVTNFMQLVPQPQVNKISRIDGKRVLGVLANVRDSLPTTEVNKIKSWLKTAHLDPRIDVKFRGADEEQNKSLNFLGLAAIGTLALIGAIMLLQFNSYWHVIIVLSAVIFSTAGVFLGYIVMQQTFSVIMTGTGIVALAGIIVNNNIVFVDTYQHLKKQGMDTYEAAIRTAAQRFRPVLLTKATAIAGMLPMMLAFEVDFGAREVIIGGPDAEQWVPMATAIVWGLLFASLLTLMVTPCMLALPQAMRDSGATFRFFRWLGRRFGSGTPAHEPKPAHPAPAE
ncbi:MAG: efflux RND transporter permease subunit [Alphaproteobacteria bacterium]|nr:efflux RND transporter permease subunit [Alphaproteobacteria bacterium]